MSRDERYQVRSPEIERALRTLATILDGEVPKGWGWGLFLVPFGEHDPAPGGSNPAGAGRAQIAAQAQGAVFWISNSERAGMIEAVKGWIEDQERRR
jgi:hypothetical protein